MSHFDLLLLKIGKIKARTEKFSELDEYRATMSLPILNVI